MCRKGGPLWGPLFALGFQRGNLKLVRNGPVEDVDHRVRSIIPAGNLGVDDVVARSDAGSVSLDNRAVSQNVVDHNVGQADGLRVASSILDLDRGRIVAVGLNSFTHPVACVLVDHVDLRVGHAIGIDLRLEGVQARTQRYAVGINASHDGFVLDIDRDRLTVDVDSDEVIAICPVERRPLQDPTSDIVSREDCLADVDDVSEAVAVVIEIVNVGGSQCGQSGVAGVGRDSAASALDHELGGLGQGEIAAAVYLIVGLHHGYAIQGRNLDECQLCSVDEGAFQTAECMAVSDVIGNISCGVCSSCGSRSRITDPSQGVNVLVVLGVGVQRVGQLRIVVRGNHVNEVVIRIAVVAVITNIVVAVLGRSEGAGDRNSRALDGLAVQIEHVGLQRELAVLMDAVDTVENHIALGIGVRNTADDVAVGVEVEREDLAIVRNVHGFILAKNEAAVGGILGAVDGNSFRIVCIGSTGQSAGLGLSNSDNTNIAVDIVRVVKVDSLALLQGDLNQNLGADSVVHVGGGHSRGGSLNVLRLIIHHFLPELELRSLAGGVAVLVVLVELGDLAEEGVDGGDDPAVFGLEDLRQIALAAEDRRLPAICSFPPSLAFLGLVMLKLHVNSVIDINILVAVDCVVVQSGAGIGCGFHQ